MYLVLHPFDLQLRHTFTITHESRKVQPSLIVELQKDGHSGYGEAAATAYYGVTMEGMTRDLEALRPFLATARWDTPPELYEQVAPLLAGSPAALCALDMAANDLWGKMLGKPLYELWGLDPARTPLTNYTIGQAPLDEMVAKMDEMPWPIYKIKLGTDRDMEIIKTLRKHTDAVFRVDANTAWTPEQAVDMSYRLKDLGVEFIEQPLKPGNWEGQAHVFANSALPVMADESCHVPSDVARCAGYFHGVNVKLVKCGGPTPALRMLTEAKSLGLKTMIGCMTESSVGISAIAQLAPLLDYVDMDGALLLANDPAGGVRFEFGRAIYPAGAGTGAWLRG